MSGRLTVSPLLDALVTEARDGDDYWLYGIYDTQRGDLAGDAQREIRAAAAAVLVTVLRDENVSEVRIDSGHGAGVLQTLQDARDAIDKALLVARRLGQTYTAPVDKPEGWWNAEPEGR